MTSLWFETALLPTGWADGVRLTIEAGAIAAVETGALPRAGDERAAIATPGLGNVHSHGFQRGMAGLTEYRGSGEDDFWSWRELMYRFLDRLTPDDVQAITAQAYAEMLEGGFTRVGEFHYLHHDPAGRPYATLGEMAGRIAAAAKATGIGLTLLPVYYAQGGFGGAPPAPGQRRFLNDPDRFARLMEESRAAIAGLPDGRLGVAPHSLRAVTPQDLKAIVPLAGPGGVHIHAAEQTKEVDDCLAWSGQRPVEWLLNEIGLDHRWRLIHATHLTRSETRRLAASGAVAGLCPITEANLGDGIFPGEDYLAAGGTMAIGTDSNVLIDAAQELRTLEYGQRLTRRARNVLATAERPSTGATLFGRALAGGTQALGESFTGLATGASADIVSLNPVRAALVGRSGDAVLDGWIFAGDARCVETVWRRGERVVEHGRHRDAAAIGAAYAATLNGLLA
ncbi:MAG: N-formimino-L-glutamate deiminase [Caulobacteraceae bacterium]|nr:N-formimino-L-glutamate deiminase [Caulobacteraceae bacterium]